jgi:hypothetical protein
MPGIRYGIDRRGACVITYAHGMDDCKTHLDICIYPQYTEKKADPTKLCMNV